MATPLRAAREISQGPSPAYSAGRRYSLYGSEDRVVLDLGSKQWKYGFSSEATPRGVIDVVSLGASDQGLFDASCSTWTLDHQDLVQSIVQKGLRHIIYRALMLNPRQRKVVIIEAPLVPLRIKEMIARVLFDNLQVPSVSFAPSPLVSLLASGHLTGLVVDCGHIETCILPVFCSRPLFPYMHTTGRAGLRLHNRLKLLLQKFALFLPPGSLSPSSSVEATTSSVPTEHLTFARIQDIKDRALFVSGPMTSQPMQVDPPEENDASDPVCDESEDVRWLQYLERTYAANSTSSDLRLRVPDPAGGFKGTIIVPGWIRERAAELFFEASDEDEANLQEALAELLLKLPVDLRKTMASSILLTGGTCMLPGFASRLEQELIHLLQSKQSPAPVVPRKLRRVYGNRFHPISNLDTHVAILNNPLPGSHPNSGSVPAFAMHALPWIGASLAVSLKTFGQEVTRETWDDRPSLRRGGPPGSKASFQMPDWTVPTITGL